MKKRILSLLLALVLALSLLPVSAVAETDVGLDLSKFTFTLSSQATIDERYQYNAVTVAKKADGTYSLTAPIYAVSHYIGSSKTALTIKAPADLDKEFSVTYFTWDNVGENKTEKTATSVNGSVTLDSYYNPLPSGFVEGSLQIHAMEYSDLVFRAEGSQSTSKASFSLFNNLRGITVNCTDGQPEFIPEQAEIVRWIYERYLTGASLRMIKDELEQQGVKCFEDSPEWTISRIRSILQNEKYCGDVLMQKTFRQDFINRKAIKNTGQLPMYLIENHHEGIVSREKYDAVQAEMARRNAAKSPSKNAVTGMASYASKYALSERLACGECGTLYRRCTWTRNGEKRVVWRCVSRLDYGKKYCHNSPTLDEAPLQQAILAALNTAMADKNSLIRQITDAMETEIIPFPSGTMSLGDIERRLRELEQQFQTLLEKATDDPAAYGGQFKEILDEQTLLKERRSGILANNNEQAKANQRIMDAAQTLENASPHIMEWDESAVRQLVETVKVLSKDEVAVTLKGGIEICQKIMY